MTRPGKPVTTLLGEDRFARMLRTTIAEKVSKLSDGDLTRLLDETRDWPRLPLEELDRPLCTVLSCIAAHYAAQEMQKRTKLP